MRLAVRRSEPLRGEVRPPSDKSLTHRAYMLASIADDESVVRSPLRGEDCEATLRCLASMGLEYQAEGDSEIRLKPARDWRVPPGELDCGNSGTTMRLLAGLIASRPIQATLAGDESLSRRPMARIAEPLRRMGAQVEGDMPPLRIGGSPSLRGIEHCSSVASAQVKSCVLLAGLRAQGETWVLEPAQSRDHTERMLRSLGVPVLARPLKPTAHVEAVGVLGGSRIPGFDFEVPGDISSAAFWMVAAAIVSGSQVTLKQVGVNPTRTGILDVFGQAGIVLKAWTGRNELGEPVADLSVGASVGGRAFLIEGPLVPRLVDEIPVLAVLATQLPGVSRIRDASELRVKESDRIAKVADGLRAMGARVETVEDGMDVEGPAALRGAVIDCDKDHRIAMAFAIAGLVAEGETVIGGAEAIATSYPSFEDDLQRLQA